MFSYGFFWERGGNFSTVIASAISRLRQCNVSLFRNVRSLRRLPTAELAGYLRNCFGRGRAMMYVPSSLYAVCLEHALRLFAREQVLGPVAPYCRLPCCGVRVGLIFACHPLCCCVQFLFVRYESLAKYTSARRLRPTLMLHALTLMLPVAGVDRMRGEEIVRMIGRFLGVHVDANVEQEAARSRCSPSRGRRPQVFMEHSVSLSPIVSSCPLQFILPTMVMPHPTFISPCPTTPSRLLIPSLVPSRRAAALASVIC